MTLVHLVIGPVGAGKSTYARHLGRELRAVRLTLDDWMAQLYGADPRPDVGRPAWYLVRRQRCLELLWQLTLELAAAGTPAVLEPGLIRRHDREALYARADAVGLPLTVHVLDAPREVRRERVQRRTQERGEAHAMAVPLAFFEFTSDLWEPPDEAECRARDVHFPPAGSLRAG